MQALAALAGLRRGLRGSGAGGLQPGFGDQAFGEQFFVARQVLLLQRCLATGLRRIALQFEHFAAGQARQRLAAADRFAGRRQQAVDDAAERRGDYPQLRRRDHHLRRQRRAAQGRARAGRRQLDAVGAQLRRLQQQFAGRRAAGRQ